MMSWGQRTITIDICVQNGPENMCHAAVCDFYFIVTFCDLALTSAFLIISFILMQYPLWTSPSILGECDVFAVRLTNPRAQKVKALYCDPWPDLDLTHDLNF